MARGNALQLLAKVTRNDGMIIRMGRQCKPSSRRVVTSQSTKYSHLVTEMPVRRIDDVEWDACTMPFRQDIHQFATRNCLACRKARCLANA